MTAFARNEVILAAGAIHVRSRPTFSIDAALTHPSQSPAILQLSGIGDSDLLTPLGIPTLIELKTVGRNLQEQTLNSIGGPTDGFDLGGIGPKDGLAFPNIRELFGERADASIAKMRASLRTWAQSEAHNAMSADALETIFGVQARTIIDDHGEHGIRGGSCMWCCRT